MLPLLPGSGLTGWAAFSWRVNWAGTFKLASLVSLAMGTGFQSGHLSSQLQQAGLASSHGSWLFLKPRLQNSHSQLCHILSIKASPKASPDSEKGS